MPSRRPRKPLAPGGQCPLSIGKSLALLYYPFHLVCSTINDNICWSQKRARIRQEGLGHPSLLENADLDLELAERCVVVAQDHTLHSIGIMATKVSQSLFLSICGTKVSTNFATNTLSSVRAWFCNNGRLDS